MKKFFSVLSILALVFTSSLVFADGYGGYADSGTDYEVGSNYDANGRWFSGGTAKSKVYAPETGSFAGNNMAGAFSSQRVKSNAEAFGCWPRKPYQRAEAYGTASQWSEAGVNTAPGTWAAGGQSSAAGYHAEDHGYFHASARGNAETTGGTLVGAVRFDTPRSSTAIAGGVVGSIGSSYAGCNDYNTWTTGMGSVSHSTYANKSGGEAWTGGTASYSYETNGYHRASGGGLAATAGYSNVTHHRNGNITARAASASFSTGGGSTNTSGGTYINSFN